MNPSIQTRVAAFFASLILTLAMVDAIAAYAFAPPPVFIVASDSR